MTIHSATLQEIPVVVGLARESFIDAVAPLYSADGVRTFLEFATVEAMQKRMQENYATYVAYRDDTLVGMAHVRDGTHISMLFVAPGEQRKGIGRALLEAVLAESTGNVFTINASPNSEQAYIRYGFRRTADEEITNGIRFISMSLKRLNQSLQPTAGHSDE
jgi:GNAT superfamily N-acetyltransferase